jgi:hypothetical protein
MNESMIKPRNHRSTDGLPSRTQQLGLIILFAALIMYVIVRVGW